MDRMRILFLNQTAHIGGAEKVLLHLARELVSRGHYIALGAPGRGPLVNLAASHGIICEEVPIPKVTRRNCNPFKMVFDLWSCVRSALQIRRVINKHDIKLIHANHLRAIFPLIVGQIKLPIIWQVHDVFRDKWPNRQLLAIVGKRVKRAICVSEFVKRNLLELGFPAEKRRIVYNAIEPVQTLESKAKVLGRLGIPQKAKIVGSIGQIVHWKGQHILVEAAPRIIAAHPSTCFVVVGKAFPGEGEWYEKELKRRVKEAGLSDRFYFVGFRQDVLSIMSILDVLVHTSVRPDPFPTVLLEGLTVGAAIVTTRVGGVPEIIEDRKNGVLIKPDNPDELAAAVIELLDDPLFLWRIKREAKRSATKFQDVKAWVDVWETNYEECL